MAEKKPFRMRAYQFAPKFLPSLITLILLPILICLGLWQLERAEQKQDIIANYLLRSQTVLANLQPIHANPEDYRYYQAELRGHYDNAHTFLLDNQIHAGRPGYQVLTPFIAEQVTTPILINRGWIPLGTRRNQLPTIAPVHGQHTLNGTIYVPHGQAFTLSNKREENPLWPRRVQTLDINQLAQQLNYAISPYVLRLAPDQKTGFIRDWPIVSMKPSKHVAYAVQWFALAATLLILFVIVTIRRRDPDDDTRAQSPAQT